VIKDFDRGWKFALVNSAGTTDPTGAYANATAPSFDDWSWRSGAGAVRRRAGAA
jgi:beta-galactosidase